MMVVTGQLLIVLSTMIIVTLGGIAFCFVGSTWEVEMKQLKQVAVGFCVLLVVGCAEMGTAEEWQAFSKSMKESGDRLQPKPAMTCLTYPGGVMRCE